MIPTNETDETRERHESVVRRFVDEVVAEGDVVVLRGVERGTHEGAFAGVAPTGRSYEMTGVAMHRVADGKTAETWANRDVLGVFRRRGTSPERPAR